MGRVAALLRRHLLLTCDIAAREEGLVDADNQPIQSWPTVVAGVACRKVRLSQEEIVTAQQVGALSYTDALLLPLGTAIAPFDRVANIRRAGVAVDTGPFVVIEVVERQTDAPEFLRALIRRVR